MKNYIIILFSLIVWQAGFSQILNGAWRLVEKNNQPVDYEAIKLFSNSYFTYAAYDRSTGKFIEASGGTYTLDNYSYKEHLEIDSNEPKHSGKTIEFKNSLKDKKLSLLNLTTGDVQVWEKFDDADNYQMSTCWRIHKKKDEPEADWRTIEYAPRKTLKMVTNSRYQVLALNSKTGQFVGTSGGYWTDTKSTYTENIEFFSKDESNVGKSLTFDKAFKNGLWLHTGKTTKGELMMEEWSMYK